jgi:hypothetical protein
MAKTLSSSPRPNCFGEAALGYSNFKDTYPCFSESGGIGRTILLSSKELKEKL